MKKHVTLLIFSATLPSLASPAQAAEPSSGSSKLLTLTSSPGNPEARKQQAEHLLASSVALGFMGLGAAISSEPAALGLTISAGAAITMPIGLTRLEEAERAIALEKAKSDALTFVDSGDEAPMSPLVKNVREQVEALGGPEAAAQVTAGKVAGIVLAM